MLDEKGCAAAMKEAWRKDGYRFMLSNGVLSVRGEGWGFQGSLENIPVKVLGLITEQLGSFPQNGDAYELRKGHAEQTVMYDQEASWWDQIRAVFDQEERPDMKQTPILLNGCEVWQDQQALTCCMAKPEKTRIISTEFRQDAKGGIWTKNILLWNTMAGTIAYVTGGVEEKFRAQMERLDGFPWCGQ